MFLFSSGLKSSSRVESLQSSMHLDGSSGSIVQKYITVSRVNVIWLGWTSLCLRKAESGPSKKNPDVLVP